LTFQKSRKAGSILGEAVNQSKSVGRKMDALGKAALGPPGWLPPA
jgi:hypothetical protein